MEAARRFSSTFRSASPMPAQSMSVCTIDLAIPKSSPAHVLSDPLAVSADVVSDIEGEERQAIDLAVVAAEGLQDRIRIGPLSAAVAVPLRCCLVRDVRLSGLVHALGDLEVSGPLEFRERLAYRPANELTLAHGPRER